VYQQAVIGRYATKSQAVEALYGFSLAPIDIDKMNMTLKDVHYEWKKIKYAEISKSLKDCYNAAWRKLEPIYNIKFKDLRTAQMQSIVNDLVGNVSLSSLQKIKVLLGQLYQYAIQNDIVSKNYAEFIKLPRSVKTVKECFTDLDIQKLKNAADVVPYADLILIMCYTGYRISEFLSLTRFHVILDGDRMFLRGGNKTQAGKNRIVPISPAIRRYVDKWLAKNGETIFCKDDGTPFGTKHFRDKCYYPTLEALGLPKLSPHATRRTFSTRLAAAGVRSDEIIKMMGHTDYSVDVDSYINPEQKTLFEAIKKLS
ncbi:MAG: tyrosine-type recombinase/integrase, partial [Acutalibacteraceae bacterium]